MFSLGAFLEPKEAIAPQETVRSDRLQNRLKLAQKSTADALAGDQLFHLSLSLV